MNQIYVGTYKVVKIFRVSRRKQLLKSNLTIEQAKEIVNSYPDSSRSMVVFYKQFTSEKYFITSNN